MKFCVFLNKSLTVVGIFLLPMFSAAVFAETETLAASASESTNSVSVNEVKLEKRVAILKKNNSTETVKEVLAENSLPKAIGSTATVENASKTEVVELTNAEVINSLDSALTLVERNKQAIDRNNEKIRQAEAGSAREQLEKEHKALQETLDKNSQNFIELATGGLLDQTDSQQFEETQLDWKNEISDVVKPLMSEIKALTATRRDQEKLRGELAFYTQQLRNLKASALKAKDLQKQAEGSSPHVSTELKELLATIASRISETESQIDVLNIKFRELKSKADKSDWVQTLRSIVTGILFHLMIALVGATLAYYCFGIFVLFLDRIDTETHPKKLFWVRAIQFFLRIIGIFVAIGVYCGILVAFSEWALMSISIIVLFGIMLSLKDVLPQYMTEMRTILNLGSIREGERVMYNGLPWRVNLLDFYTEIYNRDLSASLRLPISEVAALRSRVPIKSELWFPTRQGDYVILDDGTFGQVMRQSPDSVLLDYYGALVSYQTQDFLGMKPRNLSRQKFTVFGSIGVSYDLQAHVTNTMLDQINAFVKERSEELEYADCITNFRVAFDLADASSLNYRLIITFKGSAAKYYNDIKRWLQKVSVDCCNEYDWEIPFQQVTIHQPAVQEMPSE